MAIGHRAGENVRTDYPRHDRFYRQKAERGEPGWHSEDETADAIVHLEAATARAAWPTGGRVLEIGCGAGELSVWIAGRGFEVVGVDISPFAIDWASKRAADARVAADFQVGDVRELSVLGADRFDVVLDGFCMHCIIGPDRATVLQGVRGVLRPGGLFHLMTACGNVSGSDEYDPASRCIVINGVAARFIGLPDDVLQELEDAGLSVVRHEIESRDERWPHWDTLFADAIRPE